MSLVDEYRAARRNDDIRRESILLWGSLEGSMADDFDTPVDHFADYS